MKQSSLFICLLLAAFCIPARADDFGDIVASSDSMYTGTTSHGYAETRVRLENRSSHDHIVTLYYPTRSYGGYYNSISRISRTVKVSGGAQMVVPLLQPPLPIEGDTRIDVTVDGHDEGTLRQPHGNNHCSYIGASTSVVMVSRGLDYERIGHILHFQQDSFTAAMAVGAPDASGSGYDSRCWMPDQRHHDPTNWLEVSFNPAATVDRVTVHFGLGPSTAGSTMEVIGVSGTNLVTLPFASASFRSGSAHTMAEFRLPALAEPVKSLRLAFSARSGSTLSIDAVEISGPSGSQWASDAVASSDNSSMAGMYGAHTEQDGITALRSETSVAQWSDNWLAYTPLDAVTLGAADMDSLPPATVSALGDYLSAGGIVVLLGKKDIPSAWHATHQTALGGGTLFEVGFGRCYAFPSETGANVDSSTIQDLRNAVRDNMHYWQNLPGNEAVANGAFPVIKSLKIPTRGIVLVMLVFIIVIGPVNIIVLNRYRRRTWMLWTIPAISFATTGMVFLYSLLCEGFQANVRTSGLTFLDQQTHRASTVGVSAFYCPLTPSGGLKFDFETEATPLVNHDYGQSAGSHEIDWTVAQHLNHGWVTARVPVHFHLRKPETRRERLQVVHDNGRLQVINGLGVPIKSLWLAGADGTVYQANTVNAGEKADLIANSNARLSDRQGAAALLHELTYTGDKISLPEQAGRFLLPNTYIAQLDGNPFIEKALASRSDAKHTDISGVVFGVLDTENR